MIWFTTYIDDAVIVFSDKDYWPVILLQFFIYVNSRFLHFGKPDLALVDKVVT